MAKITITGRISKIESMKPSIRTITLKNEDSYQIFTFKMVDEDSKTIYQINLTNNEYGKKTFAKTSANRRIQVSGYLVHNPNAQVRDGQITTYANPTIRASNVIFMDQTFEKMGEIIFNKMKETNIPNNLIQIVREAPELTSEDILNYLTTSWKEYSQELFNTGRNVPTDVKESKINEEVLKNGPLKNDETKIPPPKIVLQNN